MGGSAHYGHEVLVQPREAQPLSELTEDLSSFDILIRDGSVVQMRM
jgi:hypothetical protein